MTELTSQEIDQVEAALGELKLAFERSQLAIEAQKHLQETLNLYKTGLRVSQFTLPSARPRAISALKIPSESGARRTRPAAQVRLNASASFF